MKTLLFCLACLCAITAEARSTVPPNVIVILTDDQGTLDAGCYGASDLKTPNIDALAKSGTRFTQFYAAAAVCSPSRAGLLTGRYPLRAGLIGNASSQPGKEGSLAPAQITIAEMLKTNGYATAHIGKWHLGYTRETMPLSQGFDHSFGHMGGCIDNFSHFFFWQGPNRHDLHRNGQEVFYDGQFFPRLLAKEAREFMKKNRRNPFFIYFPINAPHYPYQPDKKWLDYHKDLPYPRNLYAAFVSTMDEVIGSLLKSVNDLGLRERTIVIFQSDHGHSTEDRAHFGGGSAGAYRGAKFSLFEGGIRVPAIISWPGRVPQNAARGQMAHSCDWMPTIAELCGVKLLNNDIDGKSLVSVIQSDATPSPHSVLHWHMEPQAAPQWAVREGDWKLIGNARETSGQELKPEDKKLFLANLSLDPTESKNLASEHPEVVARLEKFRMEWIEKCRVTNSELRVSN